LAIRNSADALRRLPSDERRYSSGRTNAYVDSGTQDRFCGSRYLGDWLRITRLPTDRKDFLYHAYHDEDSEDMNSLLKGI
jgi:hypothetical protein